MSIEEIMRKKGFELFECEPERSYRLVNSGEKNYLAEIEYDNPPQYLYLMEVICPLETGGKTVDQLAKEFNEWERKDIPERQWLAKFITPSANFNIYEEIGKKLKKEFPNLLF